MFRIAKPYPLPLLLVVFWLVMLAPPSATAQAFASQPVRLLIPSSPGGPIDLIGRSLAQELSGRLGQAVVVDNRPGATGIIAADLLAKAPPDGYTIMLAAGTFATTAAFHRRLPYDPLRDFVPISQVAMLPLVMLVHPSLPVHSVGELVAYARENPGKVFFGSAGNAGPSHLAGEIFKSMAGIELVHVPYSGTSPAMAPLMAGQIPMMFDAVTTAIPQSRAGKVRALAVTSAQRLKALPDIPTVAEAGLPGYEAVTWVGILAPRATPPDVVERLHSELSRSLQAGEFNLDSAVDRSHPLASPHGTSAFCSRRSSPRRWQRCAPDRAALGRAGGVANPRDGIGHRCGSRLARAPDDGPLGRAQLPNLGSSNGSPRSAPR